MCRTRISPTVTLAALWLAGCASIGPSTIPGDRFDYAVSVSESWKRETLLNVVKLRYADTPMFLEVAQIINQYSREGQLDLRLSFGGDDSLGGTGRFSDRPTVTYLPLSGEAFGKSLLSPIPPEGVVYLTRSGWPVDFILRLCVRSMNGLSNRSVMQAGRGTVLEFDELLASLRRIQISGELGTRIHPTEGGATALIFFVQPTSEALRDDERRVRELLGLDAQANEFSLTFGSASEDPRQIAILTRSLLEIMIELSGQIDVPPEHVAEGRASAGLGGDAGEGTRLMRVAVGEQPFGDAFVQVPYRGRWFWIDDRDFASKRTLTFLNFLFSLIETGSSGAGAVLTLSAGGG